MTRKILFITGTRADFGKMLPLMLAVEAEPAFVCEVFATGMHTLRRYGATIVEVMNSGLPNVHVYNNQIVDEPMDLMLSNTIAGLARFLHEAAPDMIVVHGDRIEALAGAIVGALRNILVAHIEGGELSGTVDDLIRHSVTKLSHLHFTANEEAAVRLRQMGEDPSSIFVIGSPDLDIMLSGDLPELAAVRERYEIPFASYAVAAFHPVTTEIERMADQADAFVTALIDSGLNYVVVYPNNDHGSAEIFRAYERLAGHPRFRVIPSLRFRYFLKLLKEADFIIGNSSAGIREAPIFGRPAVNVGSRQFGRFRHETIVDVAPTVPDILDGIARARAIGSGQPVFHFGQGDAQARFMALLRDDALWATPRQKKFVDMPPAGSAP